MNSEIKVVSKTQIINIEPTSESVSIINSGPIGPAGPPGGLTFLEINEGLSATGSDPLRQLSLYELELGESFRVQSDGQVNGLVPNDGDAIVWSAADLAWIPAAVGGGGGLPGDPGQPGQRGSRWMVQAAEPSIYGDEADQDFFLNTITGDVFQFISASETPYNLVGNIKGPSGAEADPLPSWVTFGSISVYDRLKLSDNPTGRGISISVSDVTQDDHMSNLLIEAMDAVENRYGSVAANALVLADGTQTAATLEVRTQVFDTPGGGARIFLRTDETVGQLSITPHSGQIDPSVRVEDGAGSPVFQIGESGGVGFYGVDPIAPEARMVFDPTTVTPEQIYNGLVALGLAVVL